MSELSGLDPLEAAVVTSCDELGARPRRPYVKCARVVDEVERRYGYGPSRTYDALVDLARPWVRWIPMLDGHGNFGAPAHPAAEARYTECRLTRAGALAAAAEVGTLGPLPLGLIDGTLYRGGSVAPCEPAAVLQTIRAVAEAPDRPDAALEALLGPPAFPTRCDAEVLDGALRLTARVTITDGVVELTSFPPGQGAALAAEMITARAHHLRLADLEDLSTGEDRIRVHVRAGVDPAAVAVDLRQVWGVHVVVRAERLHPARLRQWVSDNWDDRAAAAIDRLDDVLANM